MVVSFSSSESSSRGRTAASTCVYITQHHCRCPNHTIPCAANSSVTRCGDYRIPFAVLHVLCFYCTSAAVCTVGIVTWKAWLMALMLAQRVVTLLCCPTYVCGSACLLVCALLGYNKHLAVCYCASLQYLLSCSWQNHAVAATASGHK